MVRAHGYILKYKRPERIIYFCHCPVESLMVSRNNMAAAMHQGNQNVKTTIKLCDNLENLTENN